MFLFFMHRPDLYAYAELEFEEVGVAELCGADVPGQEDVTEPREVEAHPGTLEETAVVTAGAYLAEKVAAHPAVGGDVAVVEFVREAGSEAERAVAGAFFYRLFSIKDSVAVTEYFVAPGVVAVDGQACGAELTVSVLRVETNAHARTADKVGLLVLKILEVEIESPEFRFA